jgi:hypothetical protein
MKQSRVLIVDAAINLILGALLITFPPKVLQLLGVPVAKHLFYPNILGGVLTGIGIALLMKYFRGAGATVGLGLGGAIAINLCGGTCLGRLVGQRHPKHTFSGFCHAVDTDSNLDCHQRG